MGTYVVNGETHTDIVGVRLKDADGNFVLFKPVSSEVTDAGFAEISRVTFAVATATYGGTDVQSGYFGVAHGLSGTPDVWYIEPKHWFDTMDEQNSIAAWSKKSSSTCSNGRRSISAGTVQAGGAVGSTSVQADDTYIYPVTGVYAKFRPTYIDADGNTQPQEYIAVAFRFAE